MSPETPSAAGDPLALSWPKKLVFALVPVVMLAGGLELGLRALGLPRQKYLAKQYEFPPADKFGRGFVRDDALFWKLQPGWDERWDLYKPAYTWERKAGAVGRTDVAEREQNFPDREYYGTVRWGVNASGFRGPEAERGKPLVVFVGSSVTFGWGVRAEDTFAEGIRQRLRRESGGGWDVLNGGVPGYSSYQCLALLQKLVHENDVAVIFFEAGINDGVPSSGAPDSAFAMSRRGVIPPSLVRSSNALLMLYLLARGGGSLEAGEERPEAGFYGTSLHRPGHSRVPREEFLANLDLVRELAAEEGARLYFLFPALYNEYGDGRLTDSAAVAPPEEIDLRQLFESHREDGLETFFLPWDEAHFSVRGHQLVAGALWARLRGDAALPSP